MTHAAKFEGGICHWNELLSQEDIALPADIHQLPDIFIYLVNNAGQAVCFTRINLVQKTVDKATKKETFTLRKFKFAKWYSLEEDMVLNAVPDDCVPGALQIKIGFGKLKHLAEAQAAFDYAKAQLKTKEPYQVS